MQALTYLHDEVQILHNDITSSNILLTDSTTENPSLENYLQIVLIDFGKATPVKNSRKYNLSALDQAEYVRKYPQIATEVLDGKTTVTTGSEMYSVGRVILLTLNFWLNYLVSKDVHFNQSSAIVSAHVIMIATPVKNSRKYNLSALDQAEYVRKYPQIATKVLDGKTTVTTGSEMYSVGRVILLTLNFWLNYLVSKDVHFNQSSAIVSAHVIMIGHLQS